MLVHCIRHDNRNTFHLHCHRDHPNSLQDKVWNNSLRNIPVMYNLRAIISLKHNGITKLFLLAAVVINMVNGVVLNKKMSIHN